MFIIFSQLYTASVICWHDDLQYSNNCTFNIIVWQLLFLMEQLLYFFSLELVLYVKRSCKQGLFIPQILIGHNYQLPWVHPFDLDLFIHIEWNPGPIKVNGKSPIDLNVARILPLDCWSQAEESDVQGEVQKSSHTFKKLFVFKLHSNSIIQLMWWVEPAGNFLSN